MKKFILSLAFVLGLSFASCSPNTQQQEATTDSIEEVVVVDSIETDSIVLDTITCDSIQ